VSAVVSRRTFLRTSVTATGGLLLSFGWDGPAPLGAQPATLQPNGFVRLAADGTVTIWSKNPDMGQGVKTALPMIPRRMDADWSRVQVRDAELDRAKFGGQGSGGSGSMREEGPLPQRRRRDARAAGGGGRRDVAGAASISAHRARPCPSCGVRARARVRRARDAGLAPPDSAGAGLEGSVVVHAARHPRARR
jgi:CO/xanthine dehydrogenase Mo-binding subunit